MSHRQQASARGRSYVGILAGAVALTLAAVYLTLVRMPGSSYRGKHPTLSPSQAELRSELRRHVGVLAGAIGERNGDNPRALAAAAAHISNSLKLSGLTVRRRSFRVGKQVFTNIEGESKGSSRHAAVILIGAHYDTAPGTPGANDNASGVAALLCLAARAAHNSPHHTIRYVAFANEEPPHFKKSSMGSLVYARECKARGERIAAMLSLETIGYYSSAPGSQHYPEPLNLLYPSTGDFVAFVANVSSRPLLRQCVSSFRKHARFPCEGVALPASVSAIGRSDHWSFWKQGYPALMVTDTAPFRYRHYHDPSDTPDKLDYSGLALVTDGLVHVVDDLSAR